MRRSCWMAGLLGLLVRFALALECGEFGLVGGSNFQTVDSHAELDCLALACSDRSVRLYDATDPDLPVFADRIDMPDSVRAVHVASDHLFVGLRGGTMRVYDVANPASPLFVRAMTVTDMPVCDFVQYEHRLLACGSSVVRLYDISDPANPVQTGSQASGTSTMISTAVSDDGDYFAVADGDLHRLFVDGVLVDESARAWSPSGTGTLRFGRALDASVPTLDADLDEVLVFDRPLGEAEVQAIFTRGGWPLP